MLLWLANSMIAATAARRARCVVICSMAGYAFARMEFPLKNVIFGMIIATLFLPRLHLHDAELRDPQPASAGWTPCWPSSCPGAAGAFGVFFMRQFFSTIPIALEESARIDGAGPWRTFFSIVLPNARAALVTLAVISFLANWNDFVFPIYVLFSPERLTLPVGPDQAAGRVHHRLPGDHGRRGDGLDPGAAACTSSCSAT